MRAERGCRIHLLANGPEPQRKVDDAHVRVLEPQRLRCEVVEDEKLFRSMVVLEQKRVDRLLQDRDAAIRQADGAHRREAAGHRGPPWGSDTLCMSLPSPRVA